jgi:pimeloyl-ACP methyl ester carboxylesterase
MQNFPALLIFLLIPLAVQAGEAELVVLLHGLARSPDSMEKMKYSLEQEGYEVCNLGYPSTEQSIEQLAADQVLPAIHACRGPERRRTHFVTHSLGGIIVRQLHAMAADEAALVFGRVVMLGPPNGGSEVVDKLGSMPPFQWLNGPAGQQLGTDENAVPVRLGATNLEVGVIAGNRSINLILSTLIPGDDDGKVSIDNARLEGMKDFIVLPVSHPFLMKDDDVIRQTINFLEAGAFQHPAPDA